MHIQGIELSGKAIGDNTAARLCELHDVWFIKLDSTKVTLNGLAQLGALPQLRHLTVRDCELSGVLEKVSGGFKSLVMIDLSQTGVTTDVLGQLPHFKQLKQVYLDRTLVKGDVVRMILDKGERIEDVSVKWCHLANEDFSCRSGELSKLRRLNVVGVPLTASKLIEIAKECRALEHLEFSHDAYDAETIQTIREVLGARKKRNREIQKSQKSRRVWFPWARPLDGS